MLDILIFLFHHFHESGEFPDTEQLSVKLNAAGFDENEINDALSWIIDLQQNIETHYSERLDSPNPRIYAEQERRILSQDALAYLDFLHSSKMISGSEREMIIDRALILGRKKLSLAQIKLIALLVLHPRQDTLNPLLIEDLLTPSPSTLVH